MNFQKLPYLLGVHLEPINCYSQADSGWLPQLIELSKDKNDNDAVVFKDIGLKI